MPQGLEVRDAASNVVIDTSTRCGRILGSFQFNSAANSSGSITDSNLSQGTPFPYVLTGSSLAPIDISFSGTTITWSGANNVGTVYYGVY